MNIQPYWQLRSLVGALGSPHVDEEAVLGLAVPVMMLRAQADGAELAAMLVKVPRGQRRRPYLARILDLVLYRRVPRRSPSQVVQRWSSIPHAEILVNAMVEGVAFVSGVLEVDFGPWRCLTIFSDQKPDEYGQWDEH